MLQQAASSALPLWLEITKAIAGPIIAAVFVVVGIWLKEVYERKKAAQAWFEQYYITEGLDQFIAHLHALAVAVISVLHPAVQSIVIDQLPFAVFSRMLTLLGDQDFSRIHFDFIVFLEKLKIKVAFDANEASCRVDKTLGLIDCVTEELEKLRKELLLISVTTKSDIYNIRNKPKVVSLLKGINDKFHEWRSATNEKSE